MKRYLSILIVLAMLVGMFAVATVALAEEPDGGTETTPAESREVGFDYDAYDEYVLSYQDSEGTFRGDAYYIEMNRNFMFANKWWEDTDKVHAIFPGINYRYQPAEAEDLDEQTETFTVKYDMNNPTGEEDLPYTDDTNFDVSYKATKHFPLPAAPEVIEDEQPVEPDPEGDSEGEPETESVPRAYFAGWEILYTPVEGEDPTPDVPLYLQGYFKASSTIAMPEHDITVRAVWATTQEEADKMVPHDDYIYLFYVSPSGSIKDDIEDWSRCQVTSTFSFTTEGQWFFLFGVVDGEAGSESGYSFKEEDLVASAHDNAQKLKDENASDAEITAEIEKSTLVYRTEDTTAPVIKLSTTQENKVRDGLTVGTTYTISTSLDITDCSSTDVSYVVYKKVKDAPGDGWVLIYDSEKTSSDRVTEGYEDCISSSGVITPLAADVSDEATYRIVYSVKDNYGNKGVAKEGDDPETQEFHPEMLLKVAYAPEEAQALKRVEAWKIVLYVIAGLSAVGIVVLLCIKPKQKTADARYNASSANGQGNSPDPDKDSKKESSDDTDDKTDNK